MKRRSFLQACLASATAPYVVTTAGVLMPVRKIVVPDLTEAALEQIIIDLSNQVDLRGIKFRAEYSFVQYGCSVTMKDGQLRVERIG